MSNRVRQPAVPQVVDRCHDLLGWLIPQIDKFPRHRRFTLGDRLETNLLLVLELLTEAAYSRDKSSLLSRANRKLAVFRHLWRLSFELRVISQRVHAHGARLVDELGRQLGGWIKNNRTRHETAG